MPETMNVAIGVDPDTTKTALAIVDLNGPSVLAVYVMRQKGKRERQASIRMAEIAAGIVKHHAFVKDEIFPPVEWVKAVAIEGQELYLPKSGKGKDSQGTKNPRSILWLAPISGIWMGLLKLLFPDAAMFFPAPSGWKGQTPKQIHHNRIGKKLGWEMENHGSKDKGYAAPVDVNIPVGSDIIESDWKHIMDAIGLALWAGEQAEKQKARIARKES